MAHTFTFKRFEAGKPVSILPANVKANPTSWEFVEIGQSMENDGSTLKVLTSAETLLAKKAYTPEQFQEVLTSVPAGIEMVKELTDLRATLISKGYQVTGQTMLSFSNGWLNCRLYRIVKLTAEQANAGTLAAL